MSENRIEQPTVDYRASFRSAAKDLAKAKRKLNARESQLIALGHDLGACYLHMSELAGGPSLTDWSARMQELHFDARCALPEAQEHAEMWENRTGELTTALQEVKNRHMCPVGPKDPAGDTGAVCDVCLVIDQALGGKDAF